MADEKKESSWLEDAKEKIWSAITAAAPHSVTDIRKRNDAAEDYAESAGTSHKRRDNETR